MRLVARVKPDSRFNPVTACSGVTFFKHTDVFVPTGFEEEAKANPYLDVKEWVEPEPEPESETATPEPEFSKPEIAILDPEPEEEPEVEINATAAAIEYAAEHGIDLSDVEGTGSDGKIILRDVKI